MSVFSAPDFFFALFRETFPETDLGRRRQKIAEDAGWFTGNPSFGKVRCMRNVHACLHFLKSSTCMFVEVLPTISYMNVWRYAVSH